VKVGTEVRKKNKRQRPEPAQQRLCAVLFFRVSCGYSENIVFWL
jgi:hypothetical protein